MGNVKPHVPVKLFAAVTYARCVEKLTILNGIAAALSGIEQQSDPYDFSQFTDYYQDEMGPDLLKHIVVFTGTILAESLPEVKQATNNFEQKYCQYGKRLINVDPGYVCAAKVLLATTKDYSHRVYLGQGIYGDVHLVFQRQSFQVQPWTYPDYRQQSIIDFFNRIRSDYLQQLK
jgi:hypothetical protein